MEDWKYIWKKMGNAFKIKKPKKPKKPKNQP
jgi:hypothetical protein